MSVQLLEILSVGDFEAVLLFFQLDFLLFPDPILGERTVESNVFDMSKHSLKTVAC